ncbi:MAG: hypothetical protein J7K04_08860 [Spirochaetales bacterium]|nr:hypothetical protein [Spirochaetales bacterium]
MSRKKENTDKSKAILMGYLSIEYLSAAGRPINGKSSYFKAGLPAAETEAKAKVI